MHFLSKKLRKFDAKNQGARSEVNTNLAPKEILPSILCGVLNPLPGRGHPETGHHPRVAARRCEVRDLDLFRGKAKIVLAIAISSSHYLGTANFWWRMEDMYIVGYRHCLYRWIGKKVSLDYPR